MRKGLTTTLLTVAIALMGFKAMAAAPVIQAIPDIIVGDAEDIVQASDPNIFVYPDAINLDLVVSDETPDDQLIWTYTKATVPGRFLINGVPAIDLGSLTPTPPTGNRLGQVLQGERNPDANVRTVTVRDNTLSPITTGGGNGPYPDPGAAGNVGEELVTLVASDGTTYGTRTVLMWSDNNGLDRTGGLPEKTPVVSMTFTTSANGWTSASNEFGGSGANASRSSNGLCLDVTATGLNAARWFSDFNFVPLVANNVYRVRMSVVTNSTINLTPLWRLVHENGSGTGATGTAILAYGGETLILDNVGGANAPSPITAGRATFDVFMTPPQVTTAGWNNASTGVFAPANAPTKDARLIFSVLDVDGVGYGGETDVGQVCLKDIDIVRWDVNSAVQGNVDLDVTSFTDAGVSSGGPAGAWQTDFILGTTTTFSGGVATIASQGTTWANIEVATFRPGDKTANPALGTGLPDNYPLTWDSNVLYHISMDLAATNAASEASPPDIMRLGADTPTQEVIGNGYWTTKYSLSAMPKSGTPQTYHFFYYSNSRTLSTGGAVFATLRPRLDIICRPDFTESTNTGSINATGCKVQRVQFE
jgi:hypothetical protein